MSLLFDVIACAIQVFMFCMVLLAVLSGVFLCRLFLLMTREIKFMSKNCDEDSDEDCEKTPPIS